jgi:hypothetical protein
MHNGIVAYGNIVPDSSTGFLIGTMDDAAILYIHFIPDPDAVYIPTNHSVEPYAAIIAYYHVSDNGSIGCDKNISTKTGRDAFNWENDGHVYDFDYSKLRPF